MAHELTQHDGLVLHRNRAWHGLGTIVQDAPTPAEALKLAKLDWEVQQWPLYATDGEGQRMVVDSHVLNVRSDIQSQLGVVGAGYSPIQNRDLAEFCEALAEQGDVVRIETAGSIKGGQKVWFMLKGESFSMRGDDELRPYILVSNGHDGGTALRCTPTTIRVVCSNTLHMVIPRREAEGGRLQKLTPASYVARHTGNVKDKIEEAKRALQLYGRSLEESRGLMEELSAKDINTEAVQKFFIESYTRDFGKIPSDPKDKREARARDRATDAWRAYKSRFDQEEDAFGASGWTLFNAYSGYLQNDRQPRIKDEEKAREASINSNLFATNADRTLSAFQAALSL